MRKTAITLMAAALALSACAQTTSKKTMKAYLVADAHLDTQWNWDVQTTIRDYVWKTMTQNLYLLKTYPDYIFNFEGGIKYWWMKEYYPREYEEVKKYVLNGRWHLAGSSWDANETVICSPESWLRNVLLGQTYYRQEFGKEGTDIFLPDCFGFGYDLPTLAAHCGLIGFSTQKLGWRTNPFYEDGRKYPFTIGLWQGIDGSRIMMTHGFDYGRRFNDEDLSNSDLLKKEIAESPLNMVYRYYGTGDTGGSPTIASVRSVEKGIRGKGPIQIVSATSDQLYKDFLPFDKHPELPVADGEMTMDVHGTGCYTSQAAMKLYNRENEHLGDAAERASVVAEYLGTTAYPLSDLTDSWRRMIWNQFHDDLPGTCIPKAYEFAWNDELLSLNRFSHVLTSAVRGVASMMNTSGDGQPIVIYNNECFPAIALADITLPQMAAAYTVTGPDGRKTASQVVEGADGEKHLLVEANLPATGFAIYHIKAAKRQVSTTPTAAKTIENSIYKLTLDNDGNICSLIDKRCSQQLVAPGKTMGLVVFNDCKSYEWPAWEVLKATLDKEPLNVKDNVKIELVDNGTLRKTLKVSKTYGKSVFTQYISLYEGAQAERIDITNDVEWQEKNALLKASFPLNVSNPKATYDLGLGSIERGNNRPQAYEVYSHEWTDLTDASGNYGVTVLNDSKYGWDKPNDNTLRLSLLFSPKANKSYTYQETQDLGHHTFTYSIIGHQGKLDKAEAVKQSTLLNSPLRVFATGKHNGKLGRSYSFLSSDNPNVTVRALKKAEVSNEYVVRVYENSGKESQTAHLTFGGHIAKAVEADGTEKTIGEASFAGNQLNVNIKPFSVKTFKVVLDNKTITAARGESLQLPFNMRCFTPDGFRNSANFAGGYSYAAELLPEKGLDVDGIHFNFADKDAMNGVSCKGQVITLPTGNYNRLYVLAASKEGDCPATFLVGNTHQTINVGDYNQFVGQWGHDGQTTGFYKDMEVAYVGTHRHSGKGNCPYEFTYMFKYAVNIPKGAKTVTLPDNDKVVVFAATLANEQESSDLTPASALFRTNNRNDHLTQEVEKRHNLLKEAKIVACSGEVNDREKAANLTDGDVTTKWCDTSNVPNFVVFDLGSEQTVSGWKMTNAGREGSDYITRSCLLQGRNTANGEWQTLDLLDGNQDNEVKRNFTPAKVRYVRLFVTGPTQNVQKDATRIYELELY